MSKKAIADQSVDVSSSSSTFDIGNLAEEVGRFFGTTEGHARKWLSQRKDLLQALGAVRERASALMAELGGENPLAWPGRKKRGSAKSLEGFPVVQPGMRETRKKRVLSAQTRAKMAASQQKRWAKIKKRKIT